MSTRMMRMLVALVSVVVLGATVGTAVYAMIEDEADPPGTFASRQADDDAAGGGSTVAAVCVAGVPDCQDTIVVGEDGGFAQCATEEQCGDFDYAKCAADGECPQLAPEIACPDGTSLEECFPDGVPAGYECVTLESFPIQTNCYLIGCPTLDGPVTTLPAPAETVVDDPGLVDPPQIDPSETLIGEGEQPPPVVSCVPPHDCVDGEGGEVICVPVDCGAEPSVVHCLPIGDPCSPEPDANVRCLPPDCAISSDGAVDCPVPLPEPCIDPTDDVPDADLTPCESPGSPGICEGGPAADCGPVCTDGTDLTPEECARIDPPLQDGGGSDGATVEPTE